MRKLFSVFALLLSMNVVHATENSIEQTASKIYVTPGSIYVASDAIYLNMNGTFMPVETVSQDENGIYVVLEELDVRVGICPKCGRTFNGTLREHLPKCPANKR